MFRKERVTLCGEGGGRHQWDPEAPAIVRDYKHIPATKTYSCKLWETRKGRQWLKKRRRYKKNVARNERRSTDYIEEILIPTGVVCTGPSMPSGPAPQTRQCTWAVRPRPPGIV